MKGMVGTGADVDAKEDQKIPEGAPILDGHLPVHIGLAQTQAMGQGDAPGNPAAMQTHGHPGTRRSGKTMTSALMVDDRERALLDQVAQYPR